MHQSSINLENVLLVEDKIWTLLEVHRFLESDATAESERELKINEIAFLCDEWWEITHEDNLNYLDKVFQKDDHMRRAVRQSLITIMLVVTTCYSYAIEQCHEQSRPELPVKLVKKLKKAIFYAHQNFLCLIELILARLPAHSSHNLWAHSLHAIVLNKRSSIFEENMASSFRIQRDSRVKKTKVTVGTLNTNNDKVSHLLRQLCSESPATEAMRTALNSPVFLCVLGVARNLHKHSVMQVRTLLFKLLEKLTM